MHAPRSLLAAAATYLALAALTVRGVGVVGEVAIGWALGRPPRVLVGVNPLVWAAGDAAASAGARLGPFVANQVRPVEHLAGPLPLPLAINGYTGGLPDWPARLLYAATGSVGAVTALHVLLGLGVLVAVHRFLRVHAGALAAGLAAAVLAADWSFVFYKKVLGGTEIALQAAVVLALWAAWELRTTGGERGRWRLGLAVGLGLGAKITFGLSLVALALAALLTRGDRPELGPLPRRSWWGPALLAAALVAPLAAADLHHLLAVPAEPHVRSHDFAPVQWRRVLTALSGGPTPVREGWGNLLAWLGDPLAFFGRAYGASPAAGWTPFRVAGLAGVAAATLAGWRDRGVLSGGGLLRLAAVFLLLQVALLLGVARDLHHLAQASPTLAAVAGLSLARLARRLGRRGPWVAAALALSLAADGAWQLARTDATVATIRVPTFTRDGQAALRRMLEDAGVRRLAVCDYESYGLLEVIAPEVEAVHGWGAASRRRGGVLPALLELARGGHFLVVRASAPMIYNLAPDPPTLARAAAALGLRVREAGRLPDGAAVLYAVEAAPGEDDLAEPPVGP